MSKERARLREQRAAQRAAAEAMRLRQAARRARRVALVRRVRPRIGRRASLFGRHSPGRRSLMVGIALAALGAIWYFFDSWPTRLALWALVLLALPVLMVVSYDRKGMRL